MLIGHEIFSSKKKMMLLVFSLRSHRTQRRWRRRRSTTTAANPIRNHFFRLFDFCRCLRVVVANKNHAHKRVRSLFTDSTVPKSFSVDPIPLLFACASRSLLSFGLPSSVTICWPLSSLIRFSPFSSVVCFCVCSALTILYTVIKFSKSLALVAFSPFVFFFLHRRLRLLPPTLRHAFCFVSFVGFVHGPPVVIRLMLW